jgi:hypothetical protein
LLNDGGGQKLTQLNDGGQKLTHAKDGGGQKLMHVNDGGCAKLIVLNDGGGQKLTQLNDGGQKLTHANDGGQKLTHTKDGGGAKLIAANDGGGQKLMQLNDGGVQKLIQLVESTGVIVTLTHIEGLQKLMQLNDGGGPKLIGANDGGGPKLILLNDGMSQKLMQLKLIVLGTQHPTKDITDVRLSPSKDTVILGLHGEKTLITDGQVPLIGVIETVILMFESWLLHWLSGTIIGGKLSNGPGHICLGATNCGISGNSGIFITKGTDGDVGIDPSLQKSVGDVGHVTIQQVSDCTVTVG